MSTTQRAAQFATSSSPPWATSRRQGNQKHLLYQPLEVDESETKMHKTKYNSLAYHDDALMEQETRSTGTTTVVSSSTSQSSSPSISPAHEVTKNTTARGQKSFQRHLILPSDTLAGLCITYKTSKQALQRANPGCCISFDGLRLAMTPGDTLLIPTNGSNNDTLPLQDQTSHEYSVAFAMSSCRFLTASQAERYLKNHKGNTQDAIREAKNDQMLHEKEQERLQQEERQRKQDAMEIQRILLQQQRQNKSYGSNNNTDTELTCLTKASSYPENDSSFLYLDQPNHRDEEDKDEQDNRLCLQGCCAFACIVVFEWIRLSIHFI